MKPDLSQGQLEVLSTVLALYAPHLARQAAEMQTQAAAAASLVEKLKSGPLDDVTVDEARLIATLAGQMGLAGSMAPGMFPAGSAEALADLAPKMTAAARRMGH